MSLDLLGQREAVHPRHHGIKEHERERLTQGRCLPQASERRRGAVGDLDWREDFQIASRRLLAAGSDVLFQFAPVFAACIFLVPVAPDGRYHVAVPLQTATARATQTVCDLLGLYVDRSGNLLTINGVQVTVAEACNGMRMVFTASIIASMRIRIAASRPLGVSAAVVEQAVLMICAAFTEALPSSSSRAC